VKIPKSGEPFTENIDTIKAAGQATVHAIAAEQLDEVLRTAAEHPEDTTGWLKAKQAAERFPREIALSGAWAQIAQVLK
jgi:2-iminoacetate synthase ThiH